MRKGAQVILYGYVFSQITITLWNANRLSALTLYIHSITGKKSNSDAQTIETAYIVVKEQLITPVPCSENSLK